MIQRWIDEFTERFIVAQTVRRRTRKLQRNLA
jgi:hypothetical protein